jgi:type VI secretion system protein ImpL
MGIYLATAIGLILYLVLAWFAGSWLHLQGTTLWMVRGGLALIGFIGAGAFLWFHHKLTRDAGESGIGPGAPVVTEIDALLNQADQRLKAAKLTAGASLRTLPLVFLLGEPNSAKTSTVLHSGLDPELLAGVVYRETETVPTNTLNIWFARGTVFIEIGGAILADARLWTRILNRTSTSGWASAFGKGVTAPRAVVVCCDCERLQAGVEKFTSTARKLGGQLQVMANALGASFPIYTLFTKLDQVPKFAEFVANLTADEARQILGTTVAQRDPGQGMFAEEEKNRLGKEFDQLVYSLAEKRLDYLSRENAPTKLPAIYEFPREFRKLRDQVLGFLVEMSRPTQLGTNPFLRGFYFSGVRPVMLRENVAAAPAPIAADEMVGSGATRILSASALAGRPAASAGPANVVRSRRVPEWSFLPYLFSEVILRDRAALGTSSQSSKTSAIRRVLLATLAVLFFCAAIAFLVSFVNNRGLQQDVIAANRALAATVPGTVESPNAEQLRQLDRLRATLVTLEANQKDGAPLSYRWGLYNGDRLYPEARSVYFGYFRRLLLDSTQKSMVATLRQLPAKPGQADQYREPYEALKAHLITTRRHDQGSKEFLAPVLLRIWSAGKGLEPERTDLARKQFEYYSDALIAADPYSSASDAPAVATARNYLTQFNGTERIYQNMLTAAGKNIAAVNFNRQFPGSAQVVVNGYEVAGAFTKDGFAAMQIALQNPQKFFGGEDWVLGEKNALPINQESLQQDLRNRYYGDFVSQWRNFLRATRHVGYTNLKDASNKLQVLSGNNSPLLQLFRVAQKNTNVDIPNMANSFQPVQTLAKDSGDQVLIAGANQPYMEKLLALQNSVNALTLSPAPQPDTGPALAVAAAAKNTVGIIAQGFRIDNDGRVDSTVKNLLEEPITDAEKVLGKIAPDVVNGAGRAFCVQYDALLNKYPFSASPTEATLQDVEAMFKPGTGALWMFYDANLKAILLRQASQFVVSPSAPMHVSGQFIMFMNHAAGISEALYPAGSPQPHFTYTLRQLPSKGIEQLSLAVDDQTLAGEGQSKQFTWTGSPSSIVKGTYSPSNSLFASEKGLWAPFHLMEDARWIPGPTPTLEWPLEIGQGHRPQTLPDGTPMVIRYELSAGAPMFRRESLGMRCPAVGAR